MALPRTSSEKGYSVTISDEKQHVPGQWKREGGINMCFLLPSLPRTVHNLPDRMKCTGVASHEGWWKGHCARSRPSDDTSDQQAHVFPPGDQRREGGLRYLQGCRPS